MKSNRREQGFTIVEISLAFIVLVVLAAFFIIQRQTLQKTARDQMRKTAINSMYQSLTEDFYDKNHYYPRTISRNELKSVDPELFTDPNGYTLDGDKCVYTNDDDKQSTDGDCDYKYAASNCDNEGKCQEFVLTANLETEADYKKTQPKNKD